MQGTYLFQMLDEGQRLINKSRILVSVREDLVVLFYFTLLRQGLEKSVSSMMI